MAPSLRQAASTSPNQPNGVRRICGVKTRRNTRNKSETIRIATWNVRTLYQTGKLANVALEADRLNMDILGVSETRWTGNGRLNVDDKYEFIYSGKDKHERGVGIMVKKKLSTAISRIITKSERIILVRFNVKPKPITIIQVYAPTSESSLEELEEFYGQLEDLLQNVKTNDITLLVGDFNAKIGKDHGSFAAGQFCLGNGNERGERLIEFAETHDFRICNTWFQQPKRRLYTWISPGDRTRNQIDFILIRTRYKNIVKNCHTFPGADCGTDHAMLAAKCSVTLKNCNKRSNRKTNWSIESLKDAEMQKNFREKIAAQMEKNKQNHGRSIEDEWEDWKKVVTEAAKETLPVQERRRKNPWMTQEIIDMMEERRKIRDRFTQDYRSLNRNIMKKCTEAKTKWYEERCQEMEELQRRNNVREMHVEIKSMMKQHKKRKTNIMSIKNRHGKYCEDKEEMENEWIEYISRLYTEPNQQTEIVINAKESAPKIEMWELENAIRKARNNKATGEDQISVDLIKQIPTNCKKQLLGILNRIYDEGTLPEDFKTLSFVPIPKKNTSQSCEEYRTIALMSHTLKLLLSIVNMRIEQKLDTNLSETQFGFVAKRGTRDAIALLKIIIQRALNVNREIITCFVDYEKAFDRVNHKYLIAILQKYNIDDKDIKIIKNLYEEQTANVKIDGEYSKRRCNIKRGVRQGCPLSPRLFNIYAEEIMKNSKIEEMGFKINGRKINCISYADDKVLIAGSVKQMQEMINRLNREGEKYGMKINVDKTKVMKFSRTGDFQAQIKIGNRDIESVKEFRYLGALITNDGRDVKEIKTRIGMAKQAFNNLERVLKNRKMGLELRKRILHCYVWSVFKYAAETWTVNAECEKRINAFEMWSYRRMMRIPWTDMVTNREVLQRVSEEEIGMAKNIQKRKKKYIGHKIREEGIFMLAVQGKIAGKAPRGRRKLEVMTTNFGGKAVNNIISDARNRLV